ncbi:alpha-L-fucosidase, partial [Planctomycetota bacterium]
MKCDCTKERWGLLSKLSVAVMVIVIMLLSTASMGIVVRVDPMAKTRLYGQTADKEGEAASLDQLPENMVIRWVGRGSITWRVRVPQSGDYEAALCYAALTSGAKLEVVAGNSKINGTVRKTTGLYEDRQISEEGPLRTRYLRNYERVPLTGVLHLPAGISKLTLRVTEPESGEVMDFRSMQMIPVAAKQAIAEAEERARRSKASTDWFVREKYGVMFHWDHHTQPRQGPKKPYEEAVRDFNVNAFADMVEEMGVGYVIFALNHGNTQWPAAIHSWEKLHPGWTTKRDLIGDIADALDKRGIKLIVYIASHVVLNDALRSDMLSMNERDGEDEVFEVHLETLNEMGLRYGRKVAGYFFDGWPIIQQSVPRAQISYERFFEACKTGNPDRIIALN